MLTESVTAVLSQGKRMLRQVVVRCALTFLIVWALGIVLGIAISVYHSRSIPTTPTWFFVVGVSALPATVAGQVVGVASMLMALTELVVSIARLPQLLVHQLTSSLKDAPTQALLGQKGGRVAPITASLLTALSVAAVATLPALMTTRQTPNEKPPV